MRLPSRDRYVVTPLPEDRERVWGEVRTPLPERGRKEISLPSSDSYCLMEQSTYLEANTIHEFSPLGRYRGHCNKGRRHGTEASKRRGCSSGYVSLRHPRAHNRLRMMGNWRLAVTRNSAIPIRRWPQQRQCGMRVLEMRPPNLQEVRDASCCGQGCGPSKRHFFFFSSDDRSRSRERLREKECLTSSAAQRGDCHGAKRNRQGYDLGQYSPDGWLVPVQVIAFNCRQCS